MIKFKFLFMFFLLSIAGRTFSDNLTVNFEGVLLTIGCRLDDDDMQKNIHLSDLRFSTLENIGRSELIPFTITLKNCSKMALNKTVKINFNTQDYEVHNGLTYLKTTGDANVLLALTDGNGKEIIFNKPISISAITETGMGGDKLKFGVYAKTPFDSRLQIGGFSSTIMFNIEYQ